eukprot:jgi/Psemu1/324498/estExt_fgenesh1_pg.C_1500011
MIKQFGTYAIGSFFLSALLPPHDNVELGFYEVLNVDNDATNEELKKAYRKLSLKLHPDKIAQRGGDSTLQEESAAEYEKIQEAYSVLINEKKRLKYDALETPARYRFVEKGAFANPQSVYENLTSASTNDKSRLVGLYFAAILLVLLQPILVAAKINQTLSGQGPLADSSWLAILVPYWIFGALQIIVTFGAAIHVPAGDRIPICLAGLEYFFWYIGVIFLSLKWDGTWDDSVLYRQALAPVFIAMLVKWFRPLMVLYTIRKDVNRMVTSDYIENEFLKGRSMDELPEEEQTELKEAFVVVSVDPEFEPYKADSSAEELEEEKVESSPEYRTAMDMYDDAFFGLARSVVFGGIFIILLTLKLDDRLGDGGNWWAVFSPIWIERGSRLVFNFYKCCRSGISGEEIVLHLPTERENNDEGESNDVNDTISNNANTGDESPAMTSHKPNIESDENAEAINNPDENSNQSKRETKETLDEIPRIIMLWYVVAKIEDSHDNPDPDDTGFNVFWLLFPFFLIFGCSLCCCAMLVFGSEPDTFGGETEEAGHDPENPPVNNDIENRVDVTIVEPVSGKQRESAFDVSVEVIENSNAQIAADQLDPVDPPPESDMDDLD